MMETHNVHRRIGPGNGQWTLLVASILAWGCAGQAPAPAEAPRCPPGVEVVEVEVAPLRNEALRHHTARQRAMSRVVERLVGRWRAGIDWTDFAEPHRSFLRRCREGLNLPEECAHAHRIESRLGLPARLGAALDPSVAGEAEGRVLVCVDHARAPSAAEDPGLASVLAPEGIARLRALLADP